MLETFISGAVISLLFSIGYLLFNYLPNYKYYKEMSKIEGVNIDHISEDICGRSSWLGANGKIEEMRSYLKSLVAKGEISSIEATALFHAYAKVKKSLY